jgi:excisionase family DNA binding protein
VPLAPVLPLSPARRTIWTVLWKESLSAEFRRQYWSSFEVAVKLHVGPETVRKWIYQGELSAVRVRQGRLFVDRRELAAFVKQLPKPGTKTRAKILKHRRMMAIRRLRRWWKVPGIDR